MVQIVNVVKENDKNWSKLDDIRGVFNMLQDWQIYHVKREANSAAYGLAKGAIK